MNRNITGDQEDEARRSAGSQRQRFCGGINCAQKTTGMLFVPRSFLGSQKISPARD